MSSSLTCCWCRKLTSASLTQHWQLNKVWMWLNTPHVYVCTQWGGPEGTAAPAIVESIWGMWAVDGCEDLMPEPESSRVRSPAQTGCWHHTLPTPGGGREAEQTSWQSPASTDTSAAFRVRGNKLQQLPWMLLRVCEVFPVLIFCSERNVSTWSPVSLSGSHNCMNSSHWLDQSIRPETIS